jgi:hypothetical protein
LLQAGERFSLIADEWTSIRNRRYLNVCLKTDKETYNLGLVRCKGSITSVLTAEMVKVSKLPFFQSNKSESFVSKSLQFPVLNSKASKDKYIFC